MATLQEVTKILSFLASLYPRYGLTPETIRAYHVILHDLPPDLLHRAALQMGARDNPFFPAAGELRAAAFELREQAAGIPSAPEAWAEVCKKFGHHGWCNPPRPEDWSHPLILKTVEAVGGWQFLCASENPTADRARFLQAYDILRKRTQAAQRMLPEVRQAVAELAGRAERDQADDAIAALVAKLEV